MADKSSAKRYKSRPVTVATFLEKRWLPAIRATVRPATHAGYASHVGRHIIPRIGRLRLDRVSPSTLNNLYAELLSSGRIVDRGALSPVTVRRIHATIHRAFRDAVKWGLIDENPAARCNPRTSEPIRFGTW